MYRTGKLEGDATGRATFTDRGGHVFRLHSLTERDEGGIYDAFVDASGSPDLKSGDAVVIEDGEDSARMDY